MTVPTGAFVARQNGKVFITGNSQGFPKSLNISKAIDKMSAKPALRPDRIKLATHIRDCRKAAKVSVATMAGWFPYAEVTKNWERLDDGNRVPTIEDYQTLIEKIACSPDFLGIVRQEAEREIIGHSENGLAPKWVENGQAGFKSEFDITASATDLAKKWEGFGTALKPAWEPILCFRKPIIEATVAEQMLSTGTGGINIGGTRVKHSSPEDFEKHKEQVERIKSQGGQWGDSWKNSSDLSGASEVTTAGRWPANVVLSHTPGCKIVGFKTAAAPVINRFTDGMKPFGEGAGHPYEQSGGGEEEVGVYECADGCPAKAFPGDAAKVFAQFMPTAPFFYTGKASKREKNKGVIKEFHDGFVLLRDDLTDEECLKLEELWPEENPDPKNEIMEEAVPEEIRCLFRPVKPEDNNHPTVKSVSLMRWLVRLVTPKGGIVLDPYCGSGTTLVAALEEDCKYIGIDRDPMYHKLAMKRVKTLEHEIEDIRDQQHGLDVMYSLPQD